MDNLYQKLLESSLRFVSFRPRSEHETRSYLQRKIVKFRDVDKKILLHNVIYRLRELGYVNDVKFVSWWIDQRQSHKPKGMRLIALELKSKGISDELIKPLIVKRGGQYSGGRNNIETDDEATLAKRAVAKKLPLWQKLPVLERKKKIYGFLSRRGFDTETIRHVIRDSND